MLKHDLEALDLAAKNPLIISTFMGISPGGRMISGCEQRAEKSEYLAKVSEALRKVKPPDAVDIEEGQRRIDEQYALIEEMQQWLDRYLKN